MSLYQLGAPLSWTVEVRDAAGTLTSPSPAPTALVSRPDGSSAAGTVTPVSVGVYTVTFPSTLLGRYVAVTTWTGGRATDHADVVDLSRQIIPLADAYEATGSPGRSTAKDDALRLLAAGATAIIEDLIGPVLVNSVTVTVSGGGSQAIPLHAYPSAVTSVTEDGSTLTEGTDYCWDEFGLLWRGSSARSGRWSSAAPRNVAVTYTVGAAALDPGILVAARELVKWLSSRQQVPRAAPGSAPGTTWTPSGFAVPNAVVEMLKPFMAGRVPGMA